MITKWSIENFKSFRKRTNLDLAPITVFAGANSSGKSTIIQSMLLMKQTVQYAPPTRPIALNGPLLKLGAFNDIRNKNASPEECSIGIGWEMSFEQSENLMARDETIGPRRYARARWGRSSLATVKVDFLWELDAGVTSGSSETLRQLQPKLKSSEISATVHADRSKSADERMERKLFISRRPSATNPDPDFAFDISEVDDTSRSELLDAKPDGKIIGGSATHFFPGRIVIQYDAARERAFRIASVLCADATYRYRLPQLNVVRVPSSVVRLLQERLVAVTGELVGNFALGSVDADSDLTVERAHDLILQTAHRLEVYKRSGRIDEKTSLGFLELRQQVEQLLFADFVKTSPGERDAIDLSIPSFMMEATEYASAYFVSGLRYLGPLRDEPRPIYPLEALVTPTEVGYRGEHTAAVLELHRDRWVSYLPSEFINDVANRKERHVSLHDAVVDWLNYVGVASEVQTSDGGKFGHSIQVKTPGVNQFHDLTNVGVGVSQVLPIIVMALLAQAPALLIFEQPELHLHPKVQARLADFFLSVALTGKQCVLETHSEYLIERFRLRIAEAEGDSLTKVMNLYFTEREAGDTLCRKVEISKYGAIADWPKDFFDQSQIETEKILQAARSKRRSEKRDGEAPQ